MSEIAHDPDSGVAQDRGGPQLIPRPASFRPGPGAPWSRPGAVLPERILVADVREALAARGPTPELPEEVPGVTLPGQSRQPAAVLCALFDEAGQSHAVLTRRSSRLRSHTHQVSFPGGRIDPGESPEQAALREAREEVGIDPSSVDIFGQLSSLSTFANPAPITPFVGELPGRPILRPNPAEVERAFTVPVIELTQPDVYREELWTFPDGREQPMSFFELIGDTVWGATARMLRELLDVVLLGG
ncbi:MAG TPA: CoA pyrophosphatase [Acidimicrobiales bacterium]